MIIKERLKNVLATNGYNEEDVTKFIKGSNDRSGWTFETQMRDSRPFPINLENKIFLFLDTERVPYSKDYLTGLINDSSVNENIIPVPEEKPKSKRKKNEYGSLQKSKALKHEFKDNNCNKIYVPKRLKDLGWKKKLVNMWFSDTSNKLSNIMSQYVKYIETNDQLNLAYFCAGTVEKLSTGSYKDDVVDLSTGFREGAVKCPYIINPDIANCLKDNEVKFITKTCGIPDPFYNEMVEGRLKLPEQAAKFILSCFNKIMFTSDEIGSEDCFIIKVSDAKEKSETVEYKPKKKAEPNVDGFCTLKEYAEAVNRVSKAKPEFDKAEERFKEMCKDKTPVTQKEFDSILLRDGRAIIEQQIQQEPLVNNIVFGPEVVNNEVLKVCEKKVYDITTLMEDLSSEQLEKLSKYAEALAVAKKAKEELLRVDL